MLLNCLKEREVGKSRTRGGVLLERDRARDSLP